MPPVPGRYASLPPLNHLIARACFNKTFEPTMQTHWNLTHGGPKLGFHRLLVSLPHAAARFPNHKAHLDQTRPMEVPYGEPSLDQFITWPVLDQTLDPAVKTSWNLARGGLFRSQGRLQWSNALTPLLPGQLTLCYSVITWSLDHSSTLIKPSIRECKLGET